MPAPPANPTPTEDKEPLELGGHASHRLKLAVAALAIAIVIGAAYATVWLTDSWPERCLVILSACVALLVLEEWRLRSGLDRLVGLAQSSSDEATVYSERSRPAESIKQLLALQAPLKQQLEREQNLLRAEARRHCLAQEELRETGERYTLAVGGASDGMWEWNIGSDTSYFSPRWKSMLGYAEHEIGGSIDEWRSRIHPEDRPRVEAALHAHLEGHSPRFEDEHRLRHKDGGWRWVLARAAAVRHASGRAYRVVGLNLDISARRQAQEVLTELADGLHGLQGEEAYTALVRRFAAILDMREAFLCECCDRPPTRVRMLAHWRDGVLAPCVEYDLAGTPCGEVIISGKTVFAPSGATARWPSEQQAGNESFIGIPCCDSKGNVMGHLACVDRKPMGGELPHDAVLRLFAVRAAVEMERRMLERLQGRTLQWPAGVTVLVTP
jgi:PAS domain S-box-containing protein